MESTREELAEHINFVFVTEESSGVVLEMRYATKENGAGCVLYQEPLCLLHRDAAEKLVQATEVARSLGYTFKIFDAYRPFDAQEKMFKIVQNADYVSDPKHGKVTHTRGIALDLTLVDLESREELDMGTDFDFFGKSAHHGEYSLITPEQHHNRVLLAGMMVLCGFEPYENEWWHYNLPHYRDYPIQSEETLPLGIFAP